MHTTHKIPGPRSALALDTMGIIPCGGGDYDSIFEVQEVGKKLPRYSTSCEVSF